jgi:hypothetical protein
MTSISIQELKFFFIFYLYSGAHSITAIASPAHNSLLSKYIYVAIASLQRKVFFSYLVPSLFGLFFFSNSFNLLLLFSVLNSGLAVSSVEEERSGRRCSGQWGLVGEEMSTTRLGVVVGGGGSVKIPPNAMEVMQSLKEIVENINNEIYATLK